MTQINFYGSNFQRQKQLVFILAFILSALVAPVYVLFAEDSSQFIAARFAEAIGFGILILVWCHYDAAEQNKPLASGFRLLLVLFGILGLFIYLLKTRGIKRGLVASGVAILLFIGTLLVSFITATVFSAILSFR